MELNDSQKEGKLLLKEGTSYRIRKRQLLLLLVPWHPVARRFLLVLSVHPILEVLDSHVHPGDQDDPVCVEGQDEREVNFTYVRTYKGER